jgi:hypothetical protein
MVSESELRHLEESIEQLHTDLKKNEKAILEIREREAHAIKRIQNNTERLLLNNERQKKLTEEEIKRSERMLQHKKQQRIRDLEHRSSY